MKGATEFLTALTEFMKSIGPIQVGIIILFFFGVYVFVDLVFFPHVQLSAVLGEAMAPYIPRLFGGGS